ncbi:hypothetical protein AeRB84_018147 [Aphanomyces euteiches]|nr:hypothetical protein AeRB84_018147 [Aphanomyces euteiches]
MSRRVIPIVVAPPPLAPAAVAKPKLPVDRFAMMRQVNLEADTTSAGQNHRERLAQESKRRGEVLLMEKEDYTFTQEGVDRLKRQEARLMMQEEEKAMRKIVQEEAAARRHALEQERRRIEAEERQRLLEQHKLEMEAKKKQQEAEIELKKIEREARMRKMKEESDRRAREEYLAKEAEKKAALERERLAQQEQMERTLLEAEEELERNRLEKEREQAANQAKIAAEEAKWKAWEEEEAAREAAEQAARRAQMAAQYEQDKKRRMELHRLRKETENRLKRIEQMDHPPPPKVQQAVQPTVQPAESTKSVPKVGSFCLNPSGDKHVHVEFKDISIMTKEQLRDEHNASVQLKKSIKQDIVAWCDAYQAKLQRPPTLEEKHEIQPLYQRYSDVDAHLRAVKHRLEVLTNEEKAKKAQNSAFNQLSAKEAASGPSATLKSTPSQAKLVEAPPPTESDLLTSKKKTVKKSIQDWCTQFQNTRGHPPTIADKKEVQHLYEEYASIDAKLKNLINPIETSAVPSAPLPLSIKTKLELPDLVKEVHRLLDDKDNGSLDARLLAEHILAIHEAMDERQCIGFLKVHAVEGDSPAATAGLQVDDLIGRFGLVMRESESSHSTLIRDVVGMVNARVSHGISISLHRGGSTSWRHLVLKPQKWRGKGLLGCVLQPYDPPQPLPLEVKEIVAPPPPLVDFAKFHALCVPIPPKTPLSDLIVWHHKVLDAVDELRVQEYSNEKNTLTVQSKMQTMIGQLSEAIHGEMYEMHAIPFLKVESVEMESPAAMAGLLEGDLLGRVGSIMYYGGASHGNLIKDLVALVNDRVNHGISISILRGTLNWTTLVLRPQKWKGQGLLGCVLHPFDPPDPVKKQVSSRKVSAIAIGTIPPQQEAALPVPATSGLAPAIITSEESSKTAVPAASIEGVVRVEPEKEPFLPQPLENSIEKIADTIDSPQSVEESMKDDDKPGGEQLMKQEAVGPAICHDGGDETQLSKEMDGTPVANKIDELSDQESHFDRGNISEERGNVVEAMEASSSQPDSSASTEERILERPSEVQDKEKIEAVETTQAYSATTTANKGTIFCSEERNDLEPGESARPQCQPEESKLTSKDESEEKTAANDSAKVPNFSRNESQELEMAIHETTIQATEELYPSDNALFVAEAKTTESTNDPCETKAQAHEQSCGLTDEAHLHLQASDLPESQQANTMQADEETSPSPEPTIATDTSKNDETVDPVGELAQDRTLTTDESIEYSSGEAEPSPHDIPIEETPRSEEPSNQDTSEASQILQHEDVASLETLSNQDLDSAFDFPKNAFAVFEEILSPALDAGLQDNDYLVCFEGMPDGSVSPTALLEAFSKVNVFPLRLGVARWRNAHYEEVEIVLESWEGVNLVLPIQQSGEASAAEEYSTNTTSTGNAFAQVNAVYEDSPADHGGLMVGDLIYWIADMPNIPTLDTLSDWIGVKYSMSEALEIYIYRYSHDEQQYDEIMLKIVPERWCAPQTQLTAAVRRHVELLGWDLIFLGSTQPTIVYPPFLLVQSVSRESPAMEGGLCMGDLVGKIGQVTTNDQDVAAHVHFYIDKPMPVQVSRFDVSVQSMQPVELTVTPQTWNGDGLLGCELEPWPPYSLTPSLVVHEYAAAGDDGPATSGITEGDLILRVGSKAGDSPTEEIAKYLALNDQVLLIVQRWEPERMEYTTFPLVGTSSRAKNTNEWTSETIVMFGWTCQTYEAYWKQYEDSHPTELPCKDCWATTFSTVAHAAAYAGHIDCLNYLGDYFDVFVTDDLGRTPLFYACYANQTECVSLLLALDYSNLRESTDLNGDTPLHAATSGNALAAMELLLREGCSPEPINYSGMRPIHIAPTVDAVQVLAAGMTDLLAIDGSGRLALSYACMAGDCASTRYLAAQCAEFIDYPDAEGDTALHFAVAGGYFDCVQALLETTSSSYIFRRNKLNKTALDVAVGKDYKDIAEYLQAHGKVESEDDRISAPV